MNATLTLECAAAGAQYRLTLAGMADVLVRASGWWSDASRRMLPAIAGSEPAAERPLQETLFALAPVARLGIQTGAPTTILDAARRTLQAASNMLGNDADLSAGVRLYPALAR